MALAVMLEIVVARGCTSGHAEAASPDRPAIVRIYNYAPIPAGLLDQATRLAAAIFDAAGLTSQWRMCGVRKSLGQPDDPICEGAAGTNEFSLRIAEGPHPGVGLRPAPEVLGYAVVFERRGVMATVHSRRVLALADRSGVDRAALMSRVMAHEVGHLLLGTTEHAPRGLMRAYWKLNAWTMSDHSEWAFSPNEVLQMRSRKLKGQRSDL
jgi:hypothetical protein